MLKHRRAFTASFTPRVKGSARSFGGKNWQFIFLSFTPRICLVSVDKRTLNRISRKAPINLK